MYIHTQLCLFLFSKRIHWNTRSNTIFNKSLCLKIQHTIFTIIYIIVILIINIKVKNNWLEKYPLIYKRTLATVSVKIICVLRLRSWAYLKFGFVKKKKKMSWQSTYPRMSFLSFKIVQNSLQRHIKLQRLFYNQK